MKEKFTERLEKLKKYIIENKIVLRRFSLVFGVVALIALSFSIVKLIKDKEEEIIYQKDVYVAASSPTEEMEKEVDEKVEKFKEIELEKEPEIEEVEEEAKEEEVGEVEEEEIEETEEEVEEEREEVEEIEIEPVIVEKAPIVHKEDPQKPKGSGDTVSISDLKKPAPTPEVKKESPKTNAPPEDSPTKPTPTPEPEEKTIRHGIDVSKWQGEIDWKKVKESGVEFAMIRVGYRTLKDGTIYEDPYAKFNLQEAIANGIPVGVYFFSTAKNKEEVLQEAQWVTSYIAPYKITYPVVYDCEGYNNKSNRHSHLNKEERTDLAIYFLDYVKDKGYTPMFYNSKSHIEANASWNTDRLNSKGYKIWVAQYPGNYSPGSRTTYTGIYHMWQYTSKGRVPGINGNVDMNEAYFGKDAPANNIPKPRDPQDLIDSIKFTEINDIVTALNVTNVRNLPTTDGSYILGVLRKSDGDTAERIAIGDNGWSKIIYNGQVAYANTKYLEVVIEEELETPEEPENSEETKDPDQIEDPEEIKDPNDTKDSDNTIEADETEEMK